MLFNDPALLKLKNTFEKEKVRKEGFIKATERGFGFLECDKDSFFITPNDMKNVMHGDKISAVIETDSEKKSKAIPEKLIEPFLSRFVGTVLFVGGKLNVLVDHPSIKNKLFADDKRTEDKSKLSNGDYVICILTNHPLKSKGPFKAEIIERVCAKDDPKAPWSVSLRRYDLPLREPDDEEFTFNENDLPREDLTEIPFVTIDSAHTEDMDDALFIEKKGDDFVLYVAIADPTGYISQDSKLNDIASHRAFSIYLPGFNIPMLPRKLSDDLCSLREGEIRKALVGIITVKKDGFIETDKTQFKLADIKSKGKLIYNEISDYIEGVENCSFTPSEEIKGIIDLLVEFTPVRDNFRSTHAAAFKNRPDYEFILTEEGALDHIEVNFRRIANQIVEESMIVANIAAGNFLANKLNSGIYNIHKGFDLQKKKDLFELLKKENCPFDETKLDTIEEYNSIRRFAVNNNNDYLDSKIRKLQEFSEISIAPGPHYALGIENYATWTSPIRKYGDMVNHRLLKNIIVNTPHPTLPDTEILKIMNEARRTNRMAERDVKDWLYVEYLEKEIEKKTVFTGDIFDISRGGLKILLQENGAMIFIPFSYISADKESLILDSDNGEIIVNGKTEKRLADTIKVKIAEVNHDTRSIIGALAEPIGNLPLLNPEDVKKKAPAFNKKR